MNTSPRNEDDEEGAGDAKLIPEWRVGADDQVIFAGLAVVGILALLLGWNALRGGDDDGDLDIAAPVVEQIDGVTGPSTSVADGSGVTTTTAAPETTTTTTTEAPATTEAAAPPTTVASIGDVQAAVDPLAGVIVGAADGTVAVLTGFVANAAESREAEDAAGQVEGITEVRNELVLLEPAVTSALSSTGVTGATAVGQGTVITVSGTIDTEGDRQPALDAAEAVEGVTQVIDDRLNVSVTADLNALPQVQFATTSSEILPVSFGDLDEAAELISGAGDIKLQIEGYTDVQGGGAKNLELSQARAEAVRSYLVNAGVDEAILTATGFGETTQFGADLASNRVVRFQQVDS